MRGLKPQDAAAIEAAEEAGLVGQIEDHPIGSYHYVKRLKGETAADVQVIVFPFRVAYQADDWKEQGQRVHEWVRYQRAAQLVAEPALRRLIRDFGAARTPTLLARSCAPTAAGAWREPKLSSPAAKTTGEGSTRSVVEGARPRYGAGRI